MSKQAAGVSFAAAALLAVASLPAMAQTLPSTAASPIRPIAQHGQCKERRRGIDCRGSEKQVEHGDRHRRYRWLSPVLREDAGHADVEQDGQVARAGASVLK